MTQDGAVPTHVGVNCSLAILLKYNEEDVLNLKALFR